MFFLLGKYYVLVRRMYGLLDTARYFNDILYLHGVIALIQVPNSQSNYWYTHFFGTLDPIYQYRLFWSYVLVSRMYGLLDGVTMGSLYSLGLLWEFLSGGDTARPFSDIFLHFHRIKQLWLVFVCVRVCVSVWQFWGGE